MINNADQWLSNTIHGYPTYSMYGIFTYIYHYLPQKRPSFVGKYTWSIWVLVVHNQ